MSSKDIPGINWPAGRILPAFQTPEKLTIYDLRGASQDVQLSATTMAGLINRPQPGQSMVYLIVRDEDDFWRKELLGSIPQETFPGAGDAVLEGMLQTFRSRIEGMVIHDPNLTDSINIATIIAGQRNGIVVSPTWAEKLRQAHNLPTLDDLSTHHWGNRLQAYEWAQQNLLNDLASRQAVASLDPGIATGLRSFLVANRIFVYWLDSRGQFPGIPGHEAGLMQQIYKAFQPQTLHLGWFIDEPSGVTLTSNAALPVLASDFFDNLEIWTGIPPTTPVASTTAAPPKPAVTSKVYLSFTISDGDNLQYIQRRLLHLWQDRARGSFPIGWTISPILSQAAPAMAAYYARTATPNDEFVAGPSGAGYMLPSEWPAPHLDTFLQRTRQLMQDMNLKTLEVLDKSDRLIEAIRKALEQGIPSSSANIAEAILELFRNLNPAEFVNEVTRVKNSMVFADTLLQQRFIQALSPIGLSGILSGAGFDKTSWTNQPASRPVYQNLGLADSVNTTLQLVRNAAAGTQQRPLFLNVYVLAWTMTPSDIKQVIQQLGSEYEVVTPGTLLTMLPPTK